METKQGTDAPRFEGANWDEPVVKVARKGNQPTLRRKVLTRGVKVLQVGGTVKHIKELLRQGMEVRLADELGNDAVRFYPLASKDCKRMFIAIQAMGAFKNCLDGKKLRVRHGDHEISREAARELIEQQANRHEQAKAAAFESVTPDTIVKCPKCGYQFRVGRSMKE